MHIKRLAGSIWYKNFKTHYPYNPQQGYRPCWDIPIGNFNCGTFFRMRPRAEWTEQQKRNSVMRYYVDTRSAVYPTGINIPYVVGTKDRGTVTIGGYTKLGNFKGLSRTEAFGN